MVALVTGASRGIGKAIAETLAKEGMTVIGTATSQVGADAITEALSAYGSDHIGLPLDLTNADSLEAFFNGLAERSLAPLVLVNNAGITRDNLLMRMKDDEWSAVIEANLTSVFKLSRHFIRGMLKARYGRIINLTSVVAASGNPGQSNYSAAKAGIIGFTKSLAQEIAARHITVNAVAPGMIDTDMTRVLTDAQRQAMLSKIPAGRLGSVNEIADAVAFLASAKAGYITGETLHVNGGLYMT
jgi:3-oxoacyl-[acyl-carrier protein] reductase